MLRPAAALALILALTPWGGAIRADDFAKPQYTRTPLLTDGEILALASEISGILAKENITELARFHRVQASAGFSQAVQFVAAKARQYGLKDVKIERYISDGEATYHTLRSPMGWDAAFGELWEVSPVRRKIADYEEMRVALADYSRNADVTAELVDVGEGISPSDYDGVDVEGKIVLAGGNVAAVHALACDERGAAGILSHQQNQTSGWSGEYLDNVRWGHLSPYNPRNRFAFMISLRQAREYRRRLASGERITLNARVRAEMKPGYLEIVTAIIPGTELEEEEIVYSCHLCHQKPGANDNASGAAAILEVGRALVSLIESGRLMPPRRTIRFIWPPEINGTLAYFAENPEIVSRMKAAVHLDMVGGSHPVTKSVLRVTHTPASIPSCVNTVADIFAEYVISGSIKAASGGGFEDALICPGGSRDSLVAETAPYEMGSDHDVFQEGSFAIPTIYLRDWPDVFIHTNNDVPENIDSTKLKRSTFIAAASGYFLARAGASEAARLAGEVFARAMSRVPRDRDRAQALESAGPQSQEDARNIIAQSLERDVSKLASVINLAPDDGDLDRRVDTLIDQLSGTWLFLTGQFTEQRRGRRITFTFEQREPPRPPRGAPGVSQDVLDGRRIPIRLIVGPMNVYYYDYLAERLSPGEMAQVRRIAAASGGRRTLYEILNLVDGERTVRDIRDFIAAAYGDVTLASVSDYLTLLESAGVVELRDPPPPSRR